MAPPQRRMSVAAIAGENALSPDARDGFLAAFRTWRASG